MYEDVQTADKMLADLSDLLKSILKKFASKVGSLWRKKLRY
jgi:hypothetical protein